MVKQLLYLFALSVLIVTSGCNTDETPEPTLEPTPAELLKGLWKCTYSEENFFYLPTGQNIGVIKGESNDTYTFESNYYLKRFYPNSKFTYQIIENSDGKIYLDLEEYDEAHTLEVITLNSEKMVWKITFLSEDIKTIKDVYLQR